MPNFCSECGKAAQPTARFCTHCGAPLDSGSREARFQSKRQKVLGNAPRSRRGKLQKFVLIGAVLTFGAWLFVSSLPRKSNPIIEAQPAVATEMSYPSTPTQMIDIPSKVENGKIIVPLDVVKQRKFVAFNYLASTAQVPLLAYISGEGKLVTAVSMCEPCNSRRFHIKGENLVCNTCGSTWELDNLQAVSGACRKFPPDPITSVVVGNEVRIDEAIVARWQPRI